MTVQSLTGDAIFQERTEEVALVRTPVTQGLLRVKKEEELQEAPSSGGGPTILTIPAPDSDGTRSGLPCREVDTASRDAVPPFLIGGRRTSPPPEDWKPMDKCYFCLDGKLPHDDQPPLVSTIPFRPGSVSMLVSCVFMVVSSSTRPTGG